MRFAIIVSTYNRPDALDLVLDSIRMQISQPDEIIIADDGSSESTSQLIHRWKKKMDVMHIRHADEGFRLAAIRNRAIQVSTADYILIIDGDIILHPGVVQDHRDTALKGHWVQGSRVLIGSDLTERWIRSKSYKYPRVWTPGIANRLNTIRNRILSRLLSKTTDRTDNVRGAHMAFWKTDLEKVNGYDERYTGWGREDNDIAVRLKNARVMRRNLKCAATTYHLFHPVTTQDTKHADALLQDARETRRVRALRGLSEIE